MDPIKDYSHNFYPVDIETVEADLSIEYDRWLHSNNYNVVRNICDVELLIPTHSTSSISSIFIQYTQDALVNFFKSSDKEPREILLMYGQLYRKYYGKHYSMPQFSAIILDCIMKMYGKDKDIALYINYYVEFATNTILKGYHELLLTFPHITSCVRYCMIFELPFVSVWELYILSCIVDDADIGVSDIEMKYVHYAFTPEQLEFENNTRNVHITIRHWYRKLDREHRMHSSEDD